MPYLPTYKKKAYLHKGHFCFYDFTQVAGLRPIQTCNNELALAIESRARMPFVGSAVVPHVAAASSLLRATAPASLIVLRGGASVGPIKMGPISVDLLLGPGGCAAAFA